MTSLPNEYSKVELPFINQLKQMGWNWLNDSDGDTAVPYLTERDNFRQVLLMERLRTAIKQINLDDDGQPWLDNQRISQAVSALDRLGTNELYEANECAYQLIWKGVTVAGELEHHGGRDVTIQYIDFEHPERNDYLIINQFRVDPPWATADRDYIIPDIVLFVNGIPLVVIECKDTDTTDPMAEGIHQLLRYSNQRGSEKPEGAERLFWYNQLMISTYWYKAEVGSLTASPRHYLEWKDTVPNSLAEIAESLGEDQLTSQQTLVAGMLEPRLLLDIVRNFVLYKDIGGRRIKLIPRYQQFRAVYYSISRLQSGQTREQHGEFDQRGGIIWHTQGSGKSMTMVFLVRKMRTLSDLRRFKVVLVTDRINLQQQLRETMTMAGEPVRPSPNDKRPGESASVQLQRILAEKGPGIVFATIQKYQEKDYFTLESDSLSYITDIPSGRYDELPTVVETRPTYISEYDRKSVDALRAEVEFPILNTAEEILVIVDEAHRSHASALHANMMRALPNCAKIGFTGTPIIIGAQKRTHEIFGPFIDKYTIKQSERDGMTVPIRYEGYTTDAEVYEGRGLDQLFENMFQERTPEELEAIKRKYATRGNVLESKSMIEAKARHILQHYVTVVMPEGFKAQLVAVSRKGAVRYQSYLAKAKEELLERVDKLNPELLSLDDEALAVAEPDIRYLVTASRHRDTVERLNFAAVISASSSNVPEKQDPHSWRRWTDRTNVNSNIREFKKRLHADDLEKQSGLAFLCVKSMLLTGFDAPYEQVMYLDRSMRGHELLQAIARVNRTADNKEYGIVVDYYGVSQHLKEALDVYTEEDVEGALISIKDEVPKLADQHRRVLNVFYDRGIEDIYIEMDACVYLLEDKRIRAEFTVKLKQFLITLNNIMPHPAALPYLKDAKMLGIIAKSAANLYRDDEINVAGVGNKVKQLIDQHIRAKGIDPTIPPISILDADFEDAIAAETSPRTQALNMQHALRYHISESYREDPVYYRKLSERLETILREFAEIWEAQIEALEELIREAQQMQHLEEDRYFDKKTPAAFFRLLAEEVKTNGELSQEDLDRLVNLTFTMVGHIRGEVARVDFWRTPVAQNQLRAWLVHFLDDADIVIEFKRIEAVADQIIEVAHANHIRLTPE